MLPQMFLPGGRRYLDAVAWSDSRARFRYMNLPRFAWPGPTRASVPP
jgi:hypothetical protein